MANDVLHFATETEPDFRYEKIQFFLRKHWVHFLKILVGGLFIGLLIFLVLLGLYGFMTVLEVPLARAFFIFTTMIVTFFYFNLFLLEIISYYFDLIIITDHRIILVRKTIFLKNDSAALDLTKIQDLSVESRGIFRNYLRYGNLIITLSTPTPPLIIECIPHPHDYLERANRVKREHILKRQERKLQAPELKPSPPKSEAYLQDIHELLHERVSDS